MAGIRNPPAQTKPSTRSLHPMPALFYSMPSDEPAEVLVRTSQALTVLVAERVMKWTVAPNRFMLGRGRWMPRWRFQPCENLIHAFQLLDAAGPGTYSMGADGAGRFWAKVQIDGVVGKGRDRSMPLAITRAVARASGIAVDNIG
jgi:hypothetical protein